MFGPTAGVLTFLETGTIGPGRSVIEPSFSLGRSIGSSKDVP